MTRPAFILVLIASLAPSIALGAPALAQSGSRTEPPTRTYATPAPAEGQIPECRAEIDCASDLAGAPVRPSKTWSVRSSQVPPDAQLQPYYPIAIVADVDAQERRGRWDDDHRHRDRPDLRYDD
jgi:hypothetical protein